MMITKKILVEKVVEEYTSLSLVCKSPIENGGVSFDFASHTKWTKTYKMQRIK